jgi:hypothetical protein
MGYVPFALGSDNCGSLRIPAVYTGAVSLLPFIRATAPISARSPPSGFARSRRSWLPRR